MSPATAAANNGNWHTAARWARMLGGHCRTAILPAWEGETHDLLIALHARRSAGSIAAHARRCPDRPRVVVLTGTDLYRDIDHDADARRSLDLATRLVVLQPLGLDRLTAPQRERCTVILQSASALTPADKGRRTLNVLMVGHLRDEKDPLCFMRAAQRLAHRADVCFEHVGAALDPALGEAARAAEHSGAHYRWLGALPRAAARQRMRHAHVLVHASRMEGGAQAVIEALRCGTPVIASRIPGNLGLLGSDAPGTFDVGDDERLAALLERCRDEPAFLAGLEAHAQALAPNFDPAVEQTALLNLVESLLETHR